MPDQNTPETVEFPIPLKRFLLTLRKTPNEVWSRLLMMDYGAENHTLTEWKGILAALRTRSA